MVRHVCNSMRGSYEFLINPQMTTGPTTQVIIRTSEQTFCNYCAIAIEKLCIPIYEYVIGNAILLDDVLFTTDWRSVSWKTLKLPSVDIGRESKGLIAEINSS